jgi:hypothetical protein
MAKINGLEFTVGADPEFFVSKNEIPVSAYNLIPGDKKNPYKVPYGAVQVDGMALEFNINPAKGEAGFIRNLNSVMDSILKMVPDYEYYHNPVADFGFDYIEAQPEDAKRLGCDPDFNAYTGKPNPTPDAKRPFRTAAGHIHIGWTDGVDPMDPGHFEACRILTKCLDVFLGVPSLLWDKDQRRRELYGKAGAFRPKPYGMEYRTLSNAWVNHPKVKYLPRFVYNNTIDAVKMAFSDPEFGDNKFVGKTAQEIVDGGNIADVQNFYESYSDTVSMPSKYREAK